MRRRVPAGSGSHSIRLRAALLTASVALAAPVLAQQTGTDTADRLREELRAKNIPLRGETSYAPVSQPIDFDALVRKMSAAKPDLMAKQAALLRARYDLADRPAAGVTMTRG